VARLDELIGLFRFGYRLGAAHHLAHLEAGVGRMHVSVGLNQIELIWIMASESK
jgi:hypothetical protein